jgi:quercetin dioxygenase-like cupin family protein
VGALSALDVKQWPENTPISQAAVTAAWAKKGYSCALWVDAPGQQWLDFVHPTDELVLVWEGTVEFEVEGQRAILGPGDEVFIPARPRHSVWNRGDTVARWFFGYRELPAAP